MVDPANGPADPAFGQLVVRCNFAQSFILGVRSAINGRVPKVLTVAPASDPGDAPKVEADSEKDDPGDCPFLTENEVNAFNAACDCLTVFFKGAM